MTIYMNEKYKIDDLLICYYDFTQCSQEEGLAKLLHIKKEIKELNTPYAMIWDLKKFNISPEIKNESLKIKKYTLSDPNYIGSTFISPNNFVRFILKTVVRAELNIVKSRNQGKEFLLERWEARRQII